jgi:hypothetical protein
MAHGKETQPNSAIQQKAGGRWLREKMRENSTGQ